MSIHQHIPIHPRFANKNFNMTPPDNVQRCPRVVPLAQNSRNVNPQPQDDHNWSNCQSDFNDEDFDLFEVQSDNQKGDNVDKSGKPYDIMIIIMVVVIIILIIAIIWLMLSNNDDPVLEKVVQPPQYMRPPGDMMGYNQRIYPAQYQQQMAQQMPQQQKEQQQMAQQMHQQQMEQQMPQQDQQLKTSKSEMDSVYQTLKEKSEKNENLDVDVYTQSHKPILSKRKESIPTLETIVEDINEEDDQEYDQEYDQNNNFQNSD